MLLLCTLTKDNPEATNLLYKKLYERITEAMEFCTSAASLVGLYVIISAGLDC